MLVHESRNIWTSFHGLGWFLRWPLKWAIVAVTLFVVSFPNPLIFVRHVQHWRDPNAMIDPDLPRLKPWLAEINERIDPDAGPKAALRTVQKFVYEKVPYEHDWVTWGSADYLPTLAEVLDAGVEDCDGQAVVAASLLRSLGYRAELVTDFAHVWVKTDKGETMSPGKRRSVVASKKGFVVDWKAVTRTLPRALAYSVSPFPLGRELIVLGVLWLVLLRPGVGWPVRLVCLLILLDGLLLLRCGGVNGKRPDVALQWWGIGQMGATVWAMLVLGWRAARHAGDVTAEAPAQAPG